MIHGSADPTDLIEADANRYDGTTSVHSGSTALTSVVEGFDLGARDGQRHRWDELT